MKIEEIFIFHFFFNFHPTLTANNSGLKPSKLKNYHIFSIQRTSAFSWYTPFRSCIWNSPLNQPSKKKNKWHLEGKKSIQEKSHYMCWAGAKAAKANLISTKGALGFCRSWEQVRQILIQPSAVKWESPNAALSEIERVQLRHSQKLRKSNCGTLSYWEILEEAYFQGHQAYPFEIPEHFKNFLLLFSILMIAL